MASGTAVRIMGAARWIVVEEGSAAVTMQRVGAAVGLTSMAIYRHYPGRDALLAAVADACFAELAEQWGSHSWRGDDEAALDKLVDEHLDFALGQAPLYAFLFTERRVGARVFPGDFRTGGSPTLNVLADGLADGVRRGVFVEHDVWEMSLLVAAQLHGLLQLHHGGRIAMPEGEFRSLCRRAVGRSIDGLRR